jgi:chemotaxis protein MotB
MSSKDRGGHGGAWKVAYADFVTAMMALFLVLWIVAMSQEMKQSIAGYFRSTSILPMHSHRAVSVYAPITQVSKAKPSSSPPSTSSSADTGGQMWAYRVLQAQSTLRETAATLQTVLRTNNNELTDVDAFRFEFTNDGLRIQAMDRADHPLFEEGTEHLTEFGHWVLSTIAWEIERYPYRIEIEGHTQGGEVPADQASNRWSLSTRRALVAQQFLEEKGIRQSQFWRVAGYADRQPIDSANPQLEVNRRLTIVLRLDPDSDFESTRRSFSPQ